VSEPLPPREMTPEEVAANITKTEAEAMAARAEAARNEAEARKLIAEARTAEAEAENEEIDLARARRLRERELTSDCYHHVYRFSGKVDESSVAACMKELATWSRMEPGCPIEIVFYSPGGGVIAGMAMFDYITELRNAGHTVTTVCMGYAASMAGILLQAGDRRVMGRESWILIHEISAATFGKMGQMEDDVNFYKSMCERVVNIFVTRSGGKLSRAKMEKAWRGHDWWLDSDTALKLGVVDDVR
jgi:ATP-dependent Clp protease, protease subunit